MLRTIRLVGPGVIDATKAKRINASMVGPYIKSKAYCVGYGGGGLVRLFSADPRQPSAADTRPA